MYGLVASAAFLLTFGLVTWRILSRVRLPAARSSSGALRVSADRYRPMLRLLSEEDLGFVAANKALHRTLMSGRRKLFRSYLRCLTRDYGYLLAGVRSAMAGSSEDRPELARALAKNRALFAFAVYKVEVRLAMHTLGVGTVDISGLVEAFEGLRAQVNVLSAIPAAI
jgi:hypothetical protein